MIPETLQPLANHLWQSTLFAVVAGLLTLVLRTNHARARYWLWLTASCKFLIPISLFVVLGSYIPWNSARVSAKPAPPSVIEQVSQPFSPAVAPSRLLATVPSTASRLPMILFGVWACGFVAVAFSWWLRWRRLRAAMRAGSPVDLDLPVPVISSPTLNEPGIFGILKPVLLLPEGIADRLTPSQFRAILAHELCHARRRDNLTLAIHMFIEAAFWFHPLLWWIGKRLVDERELACDEEVLRLGSEPRVYAESILKVCELYLESSLECVSGVTGSHLPKRIEAIMNHRIAHSLNLSKKLLLAAAGMIAIAGPIVFGIANAPRLRAQSQPTTPLAFEVASIKPHILPAGMGVSANPRAPRISGTRVTMQLVTLSDLMLAAYNVKAYQVSGAPGWATRGGNYYDVEAKAPGETAPSTDQARLMLQSLLADRFQLKLHRDSKEMAVYNLVIAKNGPKLKPVPPDAPAERPTPPVWRTSIEQLESLISIGLGRPLIDKTGLAGNVEYTMDWGKSDLAKVADRATDPEGLTLGASFSDLVQEQLGLKLESAKAQIEILVIDHAEKPSEN